VKIKYAFFWIALLMTDTAAQLFIKAGAVASVAESTLDLKVLAGYGCVILSFLLWMQILKSTRLTLALSASSLNYVTVAIAAHYVFGEPLSPTLLLGCALIAVGVFVLGVARQEA
jgi:drug/metabolite transporter (DMT)-like permease